MAVNVQCRLRFYSIPKKSFCLSASYHYPCYCSCYCLSTLLLLILPDRRSGLRWKYLQYVWLLTKLPVSEEEHWLCDRKKRCFLMCPWGSCKWQGTKNIIHFISGKIGSVFVEGLGDKSKHHAREEKLLLSCNLWINQFLISFIFLSSMLYLESESCAETGK